MKAIRNVTVAVLACIIPAVALAQQGGALTLDQALSRARTSAPQILVAQDRIEEARGRLTGASLRLLENPFIGTSVGPRFSANGDTIDSDFTISQSIEIGGRRGARVAGARAGVERETATSQNVLRRLLRDVSVAFARALAAKERLRVASSSSKIADELLQSMNRRYQAGDVPDSRREPCPQRCRESTSRSSIRASGVYRRYRRPSHSAGNVGR